MIDDEPLKGILGIENKNAKRAVLTVPYLASRSTVLHHEGDKDAGDSEEARGRNGDSSVRIRVRRASARFGSRRGRTARSAGSGSGLSRGAAVLGGGSRCRRGRKRGSLRRDGLISDRSRIPTSESISLGNREATSGKYQSTGRSCSWKSRGSSASTGGSNQPEAKKVATT